MNSDPEKVIWKISKALILLAIQSKENGRPRVSRMHVKEHWRIHGPSRKK